MINTPVPGLIPYPPPGGRSASSRGALAGRPPRQPAGPPGLLRANLHGERSGFHRPARGYLRLHRNPQAHRIEHPGPASERGGDRGLL